MAFGTYGTIGNIGTIGSIGTIGTKGTIGTIGTTGTIGTIGTIGNFGTIWTKYLCPRFCICCFVIVLSCLNMRAVVFGLFPYFGTYVEMLLC